MDLGSGLAVRREASHRLSRTLPPGAPRMPLTGCPVKPGPGAFTLKKLECSKQAARRR